MSSIRKTKKAMKNSSGFFFTIVSKEEDNALRVITGMEYIIYHKKGVTCYGSEYIPYKSIKEIK